MGKSRLFASVMVGLGLLVGAPVASADSVSDDQAKAMNVVPPGESGFMNLATFASVKAGATSSYGPNFDDQLGPLYASWKYKPFQFESAAGGTHPGGDSHVTIKRDQYGVPSIEADSDAELAYGLGYAMAQDRLFQMEAFRRVGQGTLATLTGAGAIPMDEAVRQVSEGKAARMAELAAAPQEVQTQAQRFADGINQVITEATQDPTKMPAEFVLLNALPIAPWTPDDFLGFGEYAGRFFGEFGHSEIEAAKTYVDLVAKIGQPSAEKAFNDLFRLQEPDAPTIIAPIDGTFPRHTAPPVSTAFSGSPYANHDPSLLPPAANLAATLSTISARTEALHLAQHRLGIPERLGSNAIAVNGKRTADGNPMLYSGPQTGWAVPGFFWEFEAKTPTRHQRGVTVPAVPLLVIGRNESSAFSVTSALDGNSDTFIEQLSEDNKTYQHNGQTLNVESRTETINCNNPPTVATALLPPPTVPTLCPLTPTTITVYHTIHGPALADPDAGHHLYVRQSTVDNHIVGSFNAWNQAGLAHTAAEFGRALSGNYLAFNYFYVDGQGEVAYFRSGRYPIRPANADPNLPLPGDGRYDWQGVETWSDTPHVVNPTSGYLVNWNNKPARDWWSKATDTTEPGGADRWGADHHVVPLDNAVKSAAPLTLESFGQLPRQVAYTDHRADALAPFLVATLSGSGDATLTGLGAAVASWDHQRAGASDGKLHTAATFFDRWVERMTKDTISPTADKDWAALAELALPPPCAPSATLGHYISCDNQDTLTMKVELGTLHLLIEALQGKASYDWFGGAGASAAIVKAAQDAVAELTAAQGSDPSKWSEPVETGPWSAQGAGSAQALSPVPNRGSYGQAVEVLAAGTAAAPTPGGLPNSSGGRVVGLVLPLVAAAIATMLRKRPVRGITRT